VSEQRDVARMVRSCGAYYPHEPHTYHYGTGGTSLPLYECPGFDGLDLAARVRRDTLNEAIAAIDDAIPGGYAAGVLRGLRDGLRDGADR